MRPRHLCPALLLLTAACTPERAPVAPCPPSSSPAPTTNASASAAKSEKTPASAKESGPRIELSVKPSPSTSSVDVTVKLSEGAAALSKIFVVEAPDPEAIQMKAASDAKGKIEVREARKPGRVSIELSRAPVGALELVYTAVTRGAEGKIPWMISDGDHVEISGEAWLLPDVERDAPITASLHFDVEPYGTVESGASVSGYATSFGIGAAREVATTVRALRGAMMLAGRMGTAVFDTFEGHDEAAWFGYTAFDPRPVAADTAAFRTAAGELFGEKNPVPETLLVLPEPRPLGSFIAARRTRSVLLHVAPGEPWSGPLRITTSVETLHAWIGERLWIGPEEPTRASEGIWFADGFARHLARDMLFHFGLITPEEVADEVNGLEATLATSPHGKKSNAELGAQTESAGVLPLLVARGALYALRVDAALRKKTGDKRTLVDVLRALYGKAKERRGPLPTSTWVETLKAELGEGEAAAFVETIERGGKLDVPEGALGPCFKRGKRRYERYELGFDEVATRAKEPPVLVGLREGGPAEKAGLRAGDVLVEARRTPGRSDVPAIIVVNRAGKEIEVKYTPKGPAADGRGWTRRADIPDEKCAK